MRVVTESWDEITEHIEVSYPYLFALEIMNAAKNIGIIKEKSNSVEAGEIETKVDVVFTVSKRIDRHAKSKMLVEISGDEKKGYLNVKIKPKLVLVFKNSPETFNDFYIKELLPEIRKAAEMHADEFGEKLNEKIEALKDDNKNKGENRETEV